ncbi:MAG: membrane protein insertase YidC [Candidatus Saganbacteria bacterium]|nr:membrane protein insertase YidC [Candidatus Saganbacteria bacterium]
MLETLKFFYAIGGHNWGFSIIWLTVVANLALYPLTLSSIQQMAAMQRIQPRLQNLQKKYKDDPKKLQQEMMDLYKIERVNPLGGCLPLLLKLPFFLALFWALQSPQFTALVGHEAVFIPGWIDDIAKHDPYFILPVLIGVSTWLSQKSMPSAPGQSQAMLWFMPIFITFISYNFAAGVQLYWFISNMMGWAQQAYIMQQKVPKRP